MNRSNLFGRRRRSGFGGLNAGTRSLRWQAAAAITMAAGFGARTSPAATQNAVWTNGGGDNNWGTAGNWSPGGVPNNGTNGFSDYNVSIGSPTPTFLNINATIDDLTVNSGGVFNMRYQTLTLVGPSLVDNGSIVVNYDAGGAVSDLAFNVSTSITGTGTITLQQGQSNAELTGLAGVTITQAASHTIAGYGGINLPLINNGTVNASVASQLLYLSGATTNNAVVKATGGGNLYVNGVTVTQTAGGVLNAATGSLVTLFNGAVSGGTITSAGTGAFQIQGTSSISNVTNSGTIAVPYNQQLVISGTIADSGTIVVNSNQGGAVAILNSSAGTVVSGSGSIVLEQGGPNAQLNGFLNQSAGHTIAGYGQINAVLINNGTVNANSNGNTLTLDPATSTNNSLLEATNTGTLNVNGTVLTQAAGAQIFAGPGSGVTLTGATIQGGTISSAPNTAASNVPSNAGAVTIAGSTAFNSVTSTAVVNIPYSQLLTINGNLVDNGTIVVDSNQGGATTQLNVSGGVVSGTGTFMLQQSGANAQLNGSLNQSAGHSITGYGTINAALINKGVVDANVTNQTLYVDSPTILNQGTLRATAGTLWIENASVINNSTGTISAGTASGGVTLNGGVNISGGSIGAAAPAVVTVQNLNNTVGYSALLDNITITAGTTLNEPYGNVLEVTGTTLTNNGTIVVNSNNGGASDELLFGSTLLLTGTGTLQLNQFQTNALVTGNPGVTVTQDVHHSITGYGELSLSLVNNNIVNANVNTQTLLLTGANMSNNAVFEASNGATLSVNGITVTQSTAGLINAGTGSLVLLTNAVVSGGNLSSAGTGGVTINGNTAFNSVGSNAAILVPFYNSLTINGNFVDNGSLLINQNGGGATASVNVSGGTISGNGVWTINSNGDNAEITGSLTQSAGHSIVGYGAIEATLVNNGLVNANISAQSILMQGGSKTNNSVFEATGGGSLVFNSINVTQGAGAAINISNGSSVGFNSINLVSGAINGPGGFTIGSGVATTFTNVSSAAPGLVPYYSGLTINGSFVDNGGLLINQNGGGATATVTVNGGTISGNGVWTINSNGDNAEIAGTLTQAAGHSIVGWGAIEAVFTNNGLVNANVVNQSIVLQGSNKQNNSVIEATATGSLVVNGILLNQATGAFFNIASGATALLQNANISGGTINGPGLYAVNGLSTLTSLTSTAPITVPYYSLLTLTGNIVDNGSILINQNGGGATAQLNVAGGTISGTGTWTLNSDHTNAIIAGSLTQSAGHSIVGYGTIQATLTNAGTVNGNFNGQALFASGTVTDTGLLEATGGGTLNISGNTLVQGTGTINAATASAVQINSLTAVATTISGLGTVTVGNAVFNGNTSNGGNLIVTGTATSGPVTGTGTLTVNAGGAMTSTIIRQSAVTVDGTLTIPVVKPFAPANTVGTIGTLTMGTGATFDVGDSEIDITSTPLATVNGYLVRGYNLSSGGVWAGAGLTSAAARNDTTHLTALGVVQNNQGGSPLFTSTKKFDGLTPGAGDVLVKYTYYGDANLDGKIDGSDYSLIDGGYNAHGTLTGWYHGDFNYDGVVDGSDYTLIDNAFNNQTVSLTSSALVATESAQVAPSAVPEPASIAVLGIAAMSLTRRRRC